MPLDPHSPEFSRLVWCWLDETATPEEADRLWQSVAESPDCARKMAALSRFEFTLENTVGNRVAVMRVEQQIQRVEIPPKARVHSWLSSPLLRAAAVILLLGSLAWLMWSNPSSSPRLVKRIEPVVPVLPKPRAVLPKPPVEPTIAASKKSLLERLDAFFLPKVALSHVTLQEALGQLQGQLLELNYLKAEELEKLRVTLPKDAAMRRITFQSGPIAFLKAVRAVAALGGCDVTVDEPTLALILHREIFPQIAEKRNIMGILEGLTHPDGTMAKEDSRTVSNLVADAASLGIIGDPREEMELPITRGQWEALRLLTEARQQWRLHAAPGFDIYIAEKDLEQKDRVLSESEVEEIRAQKVAPSFEFHMDQISQSPLIKPPSSPFKMERIGEVIQIVAPTEPADRNDPNWTTANPQLVVLNLAQGQGGLITVDLSSVGTSLDIRGQSLNNSFSSNAGSINGSTQIIIVPKRVDEP